MIPLGLRRSEERALLRELTGTHSIQVRVQVLDMQRDVVEALHEEVLDGQVNIDADGEVTRSANVTFLDRRRTYAFSSESPGDGALYLNRMLRIRYGVKVPDLDEWVDVPIFTGPVTKLDRAGDEVHVECQGSERLALGAAWKPMTVKKGVRKVDAIERVLRERSPLLKFDLPDKRERLPKAVSLGRQSQPWKVASKIANSMDMQLFCDGRGVVRLRRFPGNPCYTFDDGDGGAVLSSPQVAFNSDNVKNLIWVRGGKPKAKKRDDEEAGKKERERGVRHADAAPRRHPLSPWRLGNDTEPRWLLEVVDNDKIRSEKEARNVAERLLRRRLREVVEVTFDSLPIPVLEEEDLYRLNADGLGLTARVSQMSIPLRHDGTQSNGYHKPMPVDRRRKKRRNRR